MTDEDELCNCFSREGNSVKHYQFKNFKLVRNGELKTGKWTKRELKN